VSELPSGWVETTIADVTDYVSRGRSPKYAEKSSLPVVNQRSIRWFGIQQEHLKFIHPDQFPQWTEERFIREGDILWNSTGTGTIGRACLVRTDDLSPPKVVDSHVTIVRPRRDVIDPRYLFAWIRGPEVQHSIEDLATGTTNQIELGRATVMRTRVPLAPLAEQRRIADKVEALLAGVDACRERLDRIPGILKRFRQTVLATAASGKLTEQWRAERGQSNETRLCALGETGIEVPACWRLESLTSIIDPKRPLCYGVVQPGPEDTTGIPLIRVQDMENGAVLVEQLRTISAEVDQQYRRSRVQAGDLLISVVGTIGRTAVVPKKVEANIARAIARVACRAGVESRWVNTWLSSNLLQWWLVSSSNEVARKTLNLSDLAGTPIAVPPEDEQKEIVRRVESLLTIADRAQDQYERGRERLDTISPALLAQAFRGKLVPQDPSDEPAQELLARLRASPPPTMKPKRLRQSTIEMEPAMKSTDKDKLKTAILKLKKNSFSFDELRISVGGDYELIKDALFELLQEPDPVVRQVFDKKTKAMHIVRVEP